ncbi:inosine monophosphate dehydrogenase [Calocera cornea HHB12733]|uniref:Inosine monophosphate dehydrogenase n=1 Tax=Calocera cornea HHB12733 TaxID=1353952 RepID=A0A165FIK8_9BASI|nr:inosine monophosphate dehydrogenase [Calocera cornea HHB12733]
MQRLAPPITTPFTRLLGLHTPLVGGAMNTVSSLELACAVSLAGGFGFWAVDARRSMAEFKAELARAREALSAPPDKPLHLGLGALGWMLEQEPSAVREMFEHGVREPPGVQAAWLSFANDMARWVRRVRELDEERGDGRKTFVFIQVGTLGQALQARDLGADVIVLQGNEAGGHSWEVAPPTATLLAQVLDELPHSRPHILAAGGVGDGSRAAALLKQGAEGVVLGTVLAATEESLYPEASKRQLARAEPLTTVRTTLWDRVQGRPWPAGVTGRALDNPLREDERQGLSVPEIRELMKKDGKAAKERTIVWAGEGVGHVREIRPAQDVIAQLHEETVQALGSPQL